MAVHRVISRFLSSPTQLLAVACRAGLGEQLTVGPAHAAAGRLLPAVLVPCPSRAAPQTVSDVQNCLTDTDKTEPRNRPEEQTCPSPPGNEGGTVSGNGR